MVLTAAAPWPLGWLGENGRYGLIVSARLSEREVERICKLFPESEIEIATPEIEAEIARASEAETPRVD